MPPKNYTPRTKEDLDRAEKIELARHNIAVRGAEAAYAKVFGDWTALSAEERARFIFFFKLARQA